jgi:hypothetical protein
VVPLTRIWGTVRSPINSFPNSHRQISLSLRFPYKYCPPYTLPGSTSGVVVSGAIKPDDATNKPSVVLVGTYLGDVSNMACSVTVPTNITLRNGTVEKGSASGGLDESRAVITTTDGNIHFTVGADYGNIQIGGEYGNGYKVKAKFLSVAHIDFNVAISFTAVLGSPNVTPPNISGSWTGSYRGVCQE